MTFVYLAGDVLQLIVVCTGKLLRLCQHRYLLVYRLDLAAVLDIRLAAIPPGNDGAFADL